MAQEVSRNLSQINEEITKISRNLSTATKETNSLAKSLKADPKNLRLAASYAESLRGKAELARQKVALLVEKQNQLKESGVSETEEQYKKLTRQIVQAESEVNVLNKKIKETGNQRLTNLQSGISGVSKSCKVLLATVAAIGVAFAKLGDDIAKNSKKFNVSAETYQRWSNIFDKTLQGTGGYVNVMNSMVTLMGQLEKGTGKMVTALQNMGVNIEELQGKGPQELLEYILSYLSAIEDEDERMAAAAAILGSAGADLATIAGLTKEQIDEMNQELEESGIITAEQAENASKLNDAYTDFKNTLKRVIVDMGDSLVPVFRVILSLVKTFLPLLSMLAKFLQAIGPFGQVILFVLIGIIAAMPSLIALVKVLNVAAIGLNTTLTALLAKFLIVFAVLMALSAALTAIFGKRYELDVDTSSVDGLMDQTKVTVSQDASAVGSSGTQEITYNDYSVTNVDVNKDVDIDEVIESLNTKVIQAGGR